MKAGIRMRFGTAFRWVLFFIITAICAGCALWIYLWSKSGQLHQVGFNGYLWRMAIVAVPFVICIILTAMYNGEGIYEAPLYPLAIGITFFLPLVFAVFAGIESFGISARVYHILQISVTGGLNYLMAIQCLVCPNEPPKRTYPASGYNSTSTYKSSTDDCNSKGLPTGRAD